MLREKRTFWRKLLSLPSWERGLKSQDQVVREEIREVAPLVGAWIEISQFLYRATPIAVAPLVGAWIEIFLQECSMLMQSVAPLVGAWIEIV